MINGNYLNVNRVYKDMRPQRGFWHSYSLGIGIVFIVALLFSILFWMITESKAAQTFGPYKAYVVRVIDGDTFEAEILSFPGDIKLFKVRLDGADTPELRGKCQHEKSLALKAKAFTKEFIGHTVILSNVRFGSFAGRVIAIVTDNSGRVLSEALISHGLARVYSGGKRGSWCNE